MFEPCLTVLYVWYAYGGKGNMHTMGRSNGYPRVHIEGLVYGAYDGVAAPNSHNDSLM